MKPTKAKLTLAAMVVLVLSVALTTAQAVRAQQPVQGTFTTINFPGAAGSIVPPSFAVNLNSNGQFVGEYFNASTGMVHGFLLDRGTFTAIDFPGSVFTELAGINPQGDIVGNYVDNVSFRVHVLLLRLGKFTTIDFPGALFTFSNSINPEGDIAGGYFESLFSPPHGYVLRNGTFTKIDVPGALGTAALGVNSAGVVVGGYVDDQLKGHGFVLSNGSFTTVDFPGAVASVFACGAPQGGGTVALGINDQSEIVGSYCGSDGNDHGFLLSNGNFHTVDFPKALFTFAGGINSEGQIAGGYQGADGTYHGFVLSISGVGFQIASSATPTHTNESPQTSATKNIRKLLSPGLGLGQVGWLRRSQGAFQTAAIN